MLRGITSFGFIAVLGFALIADAAPRKAQKNVALEPPATAPGDAATEAAPTLVETLPAPTRPSPRGASDFVLLPFQGMLTDDLGVPLDGTVNLDLAIYDVASGGVAIWSETRSAEPVNAGLVSFSLGEIVSLPATTFDGTARWLGIRVNGDPEMPRVRLDAAAHSAHAETADFANSVSSNSIGSAEITDASIQGLDILNNTITGSDVQDNSITGSDVQDESITGADVQNSTITGADIQNNSISTSDVQDGSLTGLDIANNTLFADEMINEAGTASAFRSTDINTPLGSTINVLSRTINCPSNGFVLAFGSATFQLIHTNFFNTQATLSLSTTSATHNTGRQSQVILPSSAVTSGGTWFQTLSVNGVFSVAAGNNQIHLVGSVDSGTNVDHEATDANLTLLFVPTSYGTVTREGGGAEIADGGER